jgi:hypothetical protein
MSAAWTRAWGLTATMTLLAMAGSAGLAAAQARPAADAVAEGGDEDRPGCPGDRQGHRQDPDGVQTFSRAAKVV